MTLYITNIDYETKTVTLGSQPAPGYSSDVGNIFTPDGSKLRRGATVCMDYLDGPVYCPWPR